MKKLIFGILVALCTLTFSAFTTVNSSRLVDSFYYLGSDGNYHSYTGTYLATKCAAVASTSCIYRWIAAGGDPKIPTLTPSEFSDFLAEGFMIPDGFPNRRFIP